MRHGVVSWYSHLHIPWMPVLCMLHATLLLLLLLSHVRSVHIDGMHPRHPLHRLLLLLGVAPRDAPHAARGGAQP